MKVGLVNDTLLSETGAQDAASPSRNAPGALAAATQATFPGGLSAVSVTPTLFQKEV